MVSFAGPFSTWAHCPPAPDDDAMREALIITARQSVADARREGRE